MNGLTLPRVLLLLALGVSASVQSRAQTIEAPKPAYDVVSIKPNTTARNGVSVYITPVPLKTPSPPSPDVR